MFFKKTPYLNHNVTTMSIEEPTIHCVIVDKASLRFISISFVGSMARFYLIWSTQSIWIPTNDVICLSSLFKISHMRETIGYIIWIMGFRFTNLWVYPTSIVHRNASCIVDVEVSPHNFIDHLTLFQRLSVPSNHQL